MRYFLVISDAATITTNFPVSSRSISECWEEVYDQNFRGGRVVDGEGSSSEGCLKWGGGVIKGSFQKHLKTGNG